MEEVVLVAATNPRREEEEHQLRHERFRAAGPERRAMWGRRAAQTQSRTSGWVWAIFAIIVLAIIAFVAYMLISNGSGSSSTVGGGASAGGGYFIVALSADQLKRLAYKLRR